ncbi:MAG: AEC family transporter [Candidatus Doudnabacteria bacterium]|jgi:hypothetical protein
MSQFISVLGIVLPIFALVYIGYYFRRLKLCTDEWVDVLNKFVYYVSLPAVIIVSFWDIQWRSIEIWTAVGWNAVAYLAFAVLVFLSLQSLKHLSGATKSAMFMVSLVGNTVYLGFPILIHALGTAKASYVIASGTAHLVLGLVLSILAVDFWVVKSKKLSLYRDDLIKNPFTLSVVAGILLSLIGLRGPLLNVIHTPLAMLGGTATPLALFTLGGFLHGKFLRQHITRSLVWTGIKILAFPLFLWLFMLLLPADRNIVQVSVLTGTMPVAVTCFVIAKKFKLDEAFVTNVILLSTAISVITISIFLTVMR